MVRTYKVSVAGGIDAVTDTAFSDGRHVAYMENLDLRSGKAVPVHLPLVNPNVTVPANSVQVYAYRGQVLFSTARLDYYAEYEDNRQRIYWTQYGGNPSKMIDSTTVSLGTIAPSSPPGVTIGGSVSPQNIQAVVSAGGGLSQGSNCSFRLAYQTAFGILPPSGSVQVAIGANGSQVTLTWNNPVLETPATALLLFLGTTGGDEVYLATLGAKQTSYVYSTPLTGAGDLASNYDQASAYTYCATYLRNVNGVTDESGPSAPSVPFTSSASRTITFSPWSDGTLNSSNVVTWTSPFTLTSAGALLGYSTTSGLTNSIGVSSIAWEFPNAAAGQTGRVVCTFSSNHYFYNGQKIFFVGNAVVNAGSFTVGQRYQIVTIGTTNYGPSGSGGCGNPTWTAGTYSPGQGVSYLGFWWLCIRKTSTIPPQDGWLFQGAVGMVGSTFIASGNGSGSGTASTVGGLFAKIFYESAANILASPLVGATSLAAGQRYMIDTLGATNWQAIGAPAGAVGVSGVNPGTIFTATGAAAPTSPNGVAYSALSEYYYTIVSGAGASLPATDFTLIGAPNNNVGTTFLATGVGGGIGIVSYTQNLPVEIEVDSPSIANLSPAPMLTTCYLKVGLGFVPPIVLSGVSAFAVPSVGISTIKYNPESGVIEVLTTQPHSFNNENVLFTGCTDTGWINQMIPVQGDPSNVYVFYVAQKAMPSDTTFTNWTAWLPVTSVNVPSWNSGDGTQPIIGDILYFNLTTQATLNIPATDLIPGSTYVIVSQGSSDFTLVGAPNNLTGTSFVAFGPTPGNGLVNGSGAAIKQAAKVTATPSGAFLINALMPGTTASAGVTSPTYLTGIQHIPFNDYLQYRNLYRAGGTSSFQLVKQLPMDVLSFQDAIPDQSLGVVLPTLYVDESGVDIVVTQAPFGIVGLTRHNSMGFAYDPASNRVLWTLLNNLDAWPPEYYKDFDYRILALKSYNGALCVLSEHGIDRADGDRPSSLYWRPTKANPCRAGGSAQVVDNRLIYLGDEGLYEFDGQESKCLTDLRIPGDFWLANSAYLNNTGPNCYLVPPLQNAAYERLRGVDGSFGPQDLMPYTVSRDTQLQGIRSFVKYGKYYLYWGGDYPTFAAQTMICIDFSAKDRPITVIGIKPVDAFVDEQNRVHMLLTHPTTSYWIVT